MRFTGKILGKGEDSYVFKDGEVDNIMKELNTSIKQKLHLLNPDILQNWLELQIVVYKKPSLPRLKKVRELVLQEYNDEIIPKYREIVGKEPQKLEYSLNSDLKSI